MVGAIRQKIKDDRRSSGIAGLDFQLDGGFPKGRSIVVCGSALSGSELIAGQFWRTDRSGGSSYLMLDAVPADGMTDARNTDFDGIIAALKGNCIVVDSLSTVILRFGLDKGVFLLNDGTKELRDKGADVMFILYDGVHSAADLACICRNADIFIQLSEVLHGNDIERTLSVRKIAGCGIPNRAYPYNILADGIELSTTERVV
ncbi:MAG: hypothetical protein II893_07360 [Methanomicrobium sp.]|nr:hypothetical protein [Methanomicrobium sp.]